MAPARSAQPSLDILNPRSLGGNARIMGVLPQMPLGLMPYPSFFDRRPAADRRSVGVAVQGGAPVSVAAARLWAAAATDQLAGRVAFPGVGSAVGPARAYPGEHLSRLPRPPTPLCPQGA